MLRFGKGDGVTKNLFRAAAFGCLMALCLAPEAGTAGPKQAKKKDDVLLVTMERELGRAREQLGKRDPAPYFLSYSVHDQTTAMAVSSQGALVSSPHARTRTADVVIRVGSPALDNGHEENRSSAITSGELPLDNDPDAVAHVLWELTYRQYRQASKAYLNVKTSTAVNAKEEDTSPDFSTESPQVHTEYSDLPPFPDQALLEKMARAYSQPFRQYPHVYRSAVLLTVEAGRRHFVSSEGSREVVSSSQARLVIQAETEADDGMDLLRVETFQAETLAGLPGEAEIAARVDKIAADLKALRTAPVAVPYDGPALLSGRAAAVFFHEVLGHRLEGHRQRGEEEGQTFTKKVNTLILPEFLSIVDDPTRRTLNHVDLAGWYTYDDEGMPASAVNVVTDGVLENFLMSRMPIKGFSVSNGHGRAQAGSMPVGRQGNLIVTSKRTVPDSDLRQKLIDEVKKQGKPYGLYFEDIQGGFTLTQRALPQVFQVLPVLVWRVYPDGRPDELVRGVDIVGTPLAGLTRILLTGDTTAIFNGVCGAESGSVPVSAAAPAMLFSEIEVQKRQHSLNRPPILPPPGFDGNDASQPAATGGVR
jgi:predicted Zn-dependent protease